MTFTELKSQSVCLFGNNRTASEDKSQECRFDEFNPGGSTTDANYGAGNDTLIDKILENEGMHFDKYATVSPALRREINERLGAAKKQGNIQEQALIHSGVYSLEKYIALYVKARTAKDLMEFLEDTLDNSIM